MKKNKMLSIAIAMSLLYPGTVSAINDINNNEKLENSDELIFSQETNDLDQANDAIGSNELAKE